MLRDKILNRESGIVTYGLTPPKRNNSLEKIEEISHSHINRVRDMDIDGLVVYDIHDETDRIEKTRPFPFLPTVDPISYCNLYLRDLDIPKIICCCVGDLTQAQLTELITSDPAKERFTIFIGPSSNQGKANLSVLDAYKITETISPNSLLGGITIPERHMNKNNEHQKVVEKIKNSCKFFLSQALYNVEASKNLLSDYYYYCMDNEIDMVPILFTLAPCGSIKTFEFMKWLGINIPKWLENELLNSGDILDKSVGLLSEIFSDLANFASGKGIPIGCNVESVSTRKVEIDASVELLGIVNKIFH